MVKLSYFNSWYISNLFSRYNLEVLFGHLMKGLMECGSSINGKGIDYVFTADLKAIWEVGDFLHAIIM